MRRPAAIVVAATLTLAIALTAAVSAALLPGPDIFDFEAYPPSDSVGTDAGRMYIDSGVTFQGSDAGCQRASAQGGWDGGVYVRVRCFDSPSFGFLPATLHIDTSSRPRSTAALFVRVAGRTTAGTAAFLRVTARAGDPVVDEAELSPPPTEWVPVILRDPNGTASIQSVSVTSSFEELHVDDVGLSTTAQPDTEIVSGPAATTNQTSATFTFSANQPAATFRCALDGAAPAPCGATHTLPALGIGTHTLSVAAVDRWNAADPTPATHRWTIATPGTGGTPDAGGPTGTELPSGDLPPIAGVRVRVRLLSGEVFVRLPARAQRASAQAQSRFAPLSAFAASAPAPLADAAPIAGYVPLKGVASLPIGSSVDTRFGRLSLQAASDARPPGATGRRLQAAIFSAGIFRIRQARRAPVRAGTKTIPVETVLGSVPQAARVCSVTPPAPTPKKTVRTLHVSTKGVFQVIGGAARATGRNAEWTTSDRCDGTLTKVDRGRVTVARPGGRVRSVTVRARKSYLARARLFAIKKGRGS